MNWLPYEGKLRFFLVLLVLLMVLLVFFQFQVYLRAQAALEDETMRRIRLVTAEMAATLEAVRPASPTHPLSSKDAQTVRRQARKNGLLAIDLVADAGRIVWSTLSSRLGQTDRRGRPPESGWIGEVFLPEGESDLAYASRVTYLGAGPFRWRLAHPAAAVVATRQRLQVLAWVQAGSILLTLVSVLWFASWTLQPYRKLLHLAGGSGGSVRTRPQADLPAFLLQSFRGTVTKLETQERELSVLRDRVREPVTGAILERMASGFLRVGPDGLLAEANSAVESLLSRDRAELIGRDYRQVAGSAPRLLEILRGSMERQRTWSREVVPFPRPDGTVSHLGVSASPIAGQGGVVCLLTDLTEIRAVEERVRNRETLAMVGEWSAGMAHEFRNSLGTILGVARWMERKVRGEAREAVEEILREVRGASRAVEDFLRLARPTRLQPVAVDLGRFLRRLASQVEKEFPGRVRFRFEGEFPALRADSDLLRQALQNLLRNAAEADGNGHPPVQVTIRGERVPDTGRIRLAISDTGKGIPSNDLPHIFTPFYTTKAGGTGLGLPLARQAILIHDGDLHVESSGSGTVFHLELPLEPEVSRTP